MKHSSSFYYDLDFAEKAEDWAKEIFTGGYKVEVKCDRLAWKTGNIFVEVYSRGQKSGIATTQAHYWFFIIYGTSVSILISTERLKELAKRFYEPNNLVKGGDNNTSEGILIPLNQII